MHYATLKLQILMGIPVILFCSETNLKIRQGRQETAHLLTPEAIALYQGIITSEAPNNSLYTYEGTLSVADKEVPLEPLQLLLRGAVLRNTRWVYGVVVFTGHETKLLQNQTKTPAKRTKVERLVNTQIIFLFGLLVGIAVLCAVMTLMRSGEGFETFILLQPSGNAALRKFPLDILTFIILFNNLIRMFLVD
jgi:phospholipid-transporting ATPase